MRIPAQFHYWAVQSGILKILKNKITIVLTTHYMEEAEELSDRIGIMKDGKLLFIGNKEELFKITNKTNVENSFVHIVTGGEMYVWFYI